MHTATVTAMTESISLLVCRGCCCGTEGKHPRVDHDAQIAALEAAVADRARTKVHITDCLGPCERSNVIVVRSGRTKRWFGGMLGTMVTQSLAEWVADGATGEVPPELEIFQFTYDETD